MTDDAVRAELAELREVVVGLAGQIAQLARTVRPPSGPPRLLSKARAAALLGIDRKDTLGALLRGGAIRSVRVGRREKVPLAEIERVIADGLPSSAGGQGRARSTRRRPAELPPPNVGELIGKLPL